MSPAFIIEIRINHFGLPQYDKLPHFRAAFDRSPIHIREPRTIGPNAKTFWIPCLSASYENNSSSQTDWQQLIYLFFFAHEIQLLLTVRVNSEPILNQGTGSLSAWRSHATCRCCLTNYTLFTVLFIPCPKLMGSWMKREVKAVKFLHISLQAVSRYCISDNSQTSYVLV